MVLAEEMQSGAQPSRVIVVVAAVLLCHVIVFSGLQFPHRILPDLEESSVTVTFEDSLSKPETAAPQKPSESAPAPAEAAKLATIPTPEKVANAAPAAPAVKMIPLQAAPAPAAPPKRADARAQAQPKLNEKILDELKVQPGVVFDESKPAGTPPADAYLSDRNSNAADRGPKDLPRGDPIMDKGQSKMIRYQETRGENNLPAIAASPSSGSVEKSGKKDAGEGGKTPRAVVSPDTQTAQNPAPVSPVAPKVGIRPQPEALKRTAAVVEVPETPAAAKSESGTIAGVDATAKPPQKSVQPVNEQPQPAVSASLDEPASVPVEPAKKKQADDELAAFKAALNGVSDEYRTGKTGPAARAGATGHEGDGTLRPGNAEAVSDVLTFNIESSAAEFDEARFAKKYDATTAYLKPFMRRIDAKWKAEVYAGTRRRLDRGHVAMKIVVRNDGKLMEASEVSREPQALPDYCVANAKRGIEAAADPKCDPFPQALSKRTTIEFVVNFIY